MVLPGQPQSLIPTLHIPVGSDCPSHLPTACHQNCEEEEEEEEEEEDYKLTSKEIISCSEPKQSDCDVRQASSAVFKPPH